MYTFVAVSALILCAGGAGGLASYLLQPPEQGARSFLGGVRFVVAGAIVALAVPLFLSLAQSSLIKGLFEPATGDQRFQSALVLIGFCVAAGFASRKFMDTIAARLMQVEQTAQKAEEKSEMAKVASEEAYELVEENIDRVAEVKRQDNLVDASAERTAAEPESVNAEASFGAPLSPEERAVLSATALHDARTLTGISRDAKLPRSTVKLVVPEMVQKGVLRYTVSANSGGSRVQITPAGATILNAPATFQYSTAPREGEG